MTFEEIRKFHKPDRELHFRLPDIKGTFIFSRLGVLMFISDSGKESVAPLCYSDFDRDDWFLAQTAED